MRVCLIRHGETDWNSQGLLQGHSDIPLNEKGKTQAADAAIQYRNLKIERIITSDLLRAKETGEILSRSWNVPIFSDQNLREVFLGDAEGIHRDEVHVRYGKPFHQQWQSTDPKEFHIRFPNGESKHEAVLRVLQTFDAHFKPNDSCVGIVAHGLLLKTLVSFFQKVDRPPFWIQNLTLLECEWHEKKLLLKNIHELPMAGK